ncbi:MAG: hotdog fold domain-containing protein [Thermoanaerobaculia bacterium]
MAIDDASPGQRLLARWNRLRGIPGGKALFSYMVGRGAPYTGTIGARIAELEPGYVKAELRDRRKVRNHLRSVHAVALTNLGEVASGLATLTALPTSVRGIVTNLSTEYTKKARGRLTAECRSQVHDVEEPTPHEVEAVIRDRSGDEVARVRVTWLLSPRDNGVG